MTKKDYYDLKYADTMERIRQRKEQQEWRDVHNKHKLKLGANNYINNLNKDVKKRSRFYVGSLVRVIFIIFLAIFICRVFFKLNNSSNNLNFTSFLNFVSHLNEVDLSLSFPNFYIGGNWGVFDFLRNFFNIFATILGVVVWLGKNIINLLRYVLAIVNFLFS